MNDTTAAADREPIGNHAPKQRRARGIRFLVFVREKSALYKGTKETMRFVEAVRQQPAVDRVDYPQVATKKMNVFVLLSVHLSQNHARSG